MAQQCVMMAIGISFCDILIQSLFLNIIKKFQLPEQYGKNGTKVSKVNTLW